MGGEADAFEIRRELARCVPALLACEVALPREADLKQEHDLVAAASERGYFLPDEEEVVLLRYTQYLAVRSALVQILDDMRRHVGRTAGAWRKWPQRLPVFITAFAAGCLRHRCAGHLIRLAADRPVLWQKLDEENARAGLPRKSFTRIYKQYSSARNLTRLLVAKEFYRHHAEAIAELADDPLVGPVVGLLRREEPWMELGKREALWRRVAYRWFSLLRRQRSAWKKVTFGLFEAGGRAVADLNMPGIKPRGAPKRITSGLQQQLLDVLRPGDVLVTRHDDALSNLFLPGYWPHAALFVGELADSASIPPEQRSGELAGPCFLEAKKDGVRVRRMSETLAVDELLVLRPPLSAAEAAKRVKKSIGENAGKPYDFLFDFRTSDRLVCTEVAYRTYHGAGEIRFSLREVGGRLCLPAEAFLDQAMACGFELVACAGLRVFAGSEREKRRLPDEVLEGEAARAAFSRIERPAAEPDRDALHS